MTPQVHNGIPSPSVQKIVLEAGNLVEKFLTQSNPENVKAASEASLRIRSILTPYFQNPDNSGVNISEKVRGILIECGHNLNLVNDHAAAITDVVYSCR